VREEQMVSLEIELSLPSHSPPPPIGGTGTKKRDEWRGDEMRWDEMG